MSVDDNYTKLLLHFNGENNGTIFTDECGKTVTANGGACTKSITDGSGLTSAYFVAGDYLTIPNSSDWNFSNNDFTIDCWLYHSDTFYTNECIVTNRLNDPSYGEFCLLLHSGKPKFLACTSSNSFAIDISATTPLTPNQWHHLAIIRNGDVFTLYVDGISVATTTSDITLRDSDAGITIGSVGNTTESLYVGYINKLRISAGVARWIENFTPPTDTYIIDSYTKLYLPLSSDFTDSCDHSITPNGNVHIGQPYSSKFGSASSYFNGSSYLSLASNEDFNFGTGDFTIDMWIYPTSLSGYGYQCWIQIDTTNPYLYIGINAGGSGTPFVYLDGVVIDGCTNFVLNAWHHWAIVRKDGALTMYLNGINIGSAQFNYDLGLGLLTIGATNSGNYKALGYMDELRISKGVARWTEDFIPPTVPYGMVLGQFLSCMSKMW